jgi:cold-inducible RNA-binding protein
MRARTRRFKELSMKKIYVGNLSRQTTEASLTAVFAPFGTVHSASIVRDRYTNEPRGFGFIEMNDDHATAAIAGLKETEVDGRVLTVNEARPREGGRGNAGGGRRW